MMKKCFKVVFWAKQKSIKRLLVLSKKQLKKDILSRFYSCLFSEAKS